MSPPAGASTNINFDYYSPSTNPTLGAETHLGVFPEKGDRNDEAHPALQREASQASGSGDSDADPLTPDVQIKDESDSEKEAGVESDDEDLRTFESKASLPTARVEHRTLQELMDLLDTEAVDLNPVYQREVVWDRTRMMGLIDSIIENYYVPPIIFNRQIYRKPGSLTGQIRRVCVDGKQRLSSVKAFMEGKIGCHDRRGGVWYYTANSSGEGKKKRRTIPEHVKEQFRNRKFICYEYPNLHQSQEEDLFSRVQKGVQLTTAEKMRATTGPWQEFAKLYEKDFQGVVVLSATKRSAGFNNILVSFGMILEARRCIAIGARPELKTPALVIKALIKKTQDYHAENRDILRRTYVKFQELVESDSKTFQDNGYTHAKLFSPFEMVATAVLISLFMEKDNQFLLQKILLMRHCLRRNLKDLRMNKDSWFVAWDFIENLLDPPSLPPQLLENWNKLKRRRDHLPRSTPAIMQNPLSSDTLRAHPVLAARLSCMETPIVQPPSASPRNISLTPTMPKDAPLPGPISSPSLPRRNDSTGPIINAQLQHIHGLPSFSTHKAKIPSVNGKPMSSAYMSPYTPASSSQDTGARAQPQQLDKEPRRNELRQAPGNAYLQRTDNAEHPRPASPPRPIQLQQVARSGSNSTQHPQEAGQLRTSEKEQTRHAEPINGIKRKRLARFTTSSAGSKDPGRAQPAGPAKPSATQTTTPESVQDPLRQESPTEEAVREDHTKQAEGNGSATLFVGNLSWNVDEAWLSREIEVYVEPKAVRIMTDRATGRSKGFGYVEFETAEAATAALNATKPLEIDGRLLNVDYSTPRSEGQNPQRDRNSKKQAHSPKKRVSSLDATELSDDEDKIESAEELLAKFKPHISKRVKR